MTTKSVQNLIKLANELEGNELKPYNPPGNEPGLTIKLRDFYSDANYDCTEDELVHTIMYLEENQLFDSEVERSLIRWLKLRGAERFGWGS